MYFLMIKRSISCDSKKEAIDLYNRYLKFMKNFDDDYDYVDRLRIYNDDGDVIHECKRFK